MTQTTDYAVAWYGVWEKNKHKRMNNDYNRANSRDMGVHIEGMGLNMEHNYKKEK